MLDISLRDLLEAGVHFGHQTGRWNPRMKPYIYGAKDGIHVIDLQQTARGLVDACRFATAVVASGKPVLFVGTKRAARDVVAEEAERAGQYWVNHRWLGGTLTNWQTVKKSIEKLRKLEHARDEGRFNMLTKKEALLATREIEKMERTFGGIKEMKGLPGAIFIIDPRKEHLAVHEAKTLNIPIIALCDTNADPTGIDHVIPGNDDAIKAVRLFTAAIAEACIAGRNQATSRAAEEAFAPDVGAGPEVVAKRSAPAAEAPAAEAPADEAEPAADEASAEA